MTEPEKPVGKQVGQVRIKLDPLGCAVVKKRGKTSPFKHTQKTYASLFNIFFTFVLLKKIVVLCLSHLDIFFVV